MLVLSEHFYRLSVFAILPNIIATITVGVSAIDHIAMIIITRLRADAAEDR